MSRGISWTLVVLVLSGCGAAAAEPARRHTVEIRAFQFEPATLRVAEGDTVVWVNRDGVPHTATASAADFDTGEVAAGESRWIVAGKPGRQSYICAYHPGMQAELDVR